jgi:hypothetical protein
LSSVECTASRIFHRLLILNSFIWSSLIQHYTSECRTRRTNNHCYKNSCVCQLLHAIVLRSWFQQLVNSVSWLFSVRSLLHQLQVTWKAFQQGTNTNTTEYLSLLHLGLLLDNLAQLDESLWFITRLLSAHFLILWNQRLILTMQALCTRKS